VSMRSEGGGKERSKSERQRKRREAMGKMHQQGPNTVESIIDVVGKLMNCTNRASEHVPTESGTGRQAKVRLRRRDGQLVRQNLSAFLRFFVEPAVPLVSDESSSKVCDMDRTRVVEHPKVPAPGCSKVRC